MNSRSFYSHTWWYWYPYSYQIPPFAGIVYRVFVDNDPGAAYITIRTVGGISAILRYAYEGAALEDMRKDSEYAGYELVTASDTMKVIIGNYKH